MLVQEGGSFGERISPGGDSGFVPAPFIGPSGVILDLGISEDSESFIPEQQSRALPISSLKRALPHTQQQQQQQQRSRFGESLLDALLLFISCAFLVMRCTRAEN